MATTSLPEEERVLVGGPVTIGEPTAPVTDLALVGQEIVLGEPEPIDIGTTEIRRVKRWVTETIPPRVEQVFGSRALTIWDAITRLTQMLGVIAEVTLSNSGQPTVVLVDGEEYLDGKVFRLFERGSRRHRQLVYGSGIEDLTESRDLVAGARVPWVEAVSIDPDTGETRRERYGRGGGIGDGGEQLFAHGVVQEEALKKLARSAWRQLNQGELQLSLATGLPWSEGGGVLDPDLLDCASGAAVEVVFAAVAKHRGSSLERLLIDQGVPVPAARVLARASERVRPALFFQVAELVHSYGGTGDGDYSCTMTLQTFLDDGLKADVIEVEDIS